MGHEGNYKIYSLTEEDKKYDFDKLSGKGGVVEIPFPHEDVPPFHQIVTFCNQTCEYLNQPGGVAVIHCSKDNISKVFMASFLLYLGIFETHQEALYILSKKRSGTISPCERRYVGYFQKYIRNNLGVGRPLCFGDKALIFLRARLMPLKNPKFEALLKVHCNGSEFECAETTGNPLPQTSTKFSDVITPDGTAGNELGFTIYGDVKFVFFNDVPDPPKQICTIWINTDFVENGYVCLPKRSITIDETDVKFPRDFKIELFFMSHTS